MTVLRGGRGIGPAVEGEVLVSRHAFSARYDLDRDRGVFSRPTHDLFGQSVAGKILVFTTAKGGVATAWALLDMKARGVAPLGLVFRLTNPIMVQGAALADLPLVDSLRPDPITTLRTGDRVRLDPRRGTLALLDRPGGGRP